MQVIIKKLRNCCTNRREDMKRVGEGGNMKAKEIGNGEEVKEVEKKI